MYVHVDASARIVKTTCIQTFSDNSSVPVPDTSTLTSHATAIWAYTYVYRRLLAS